MERSLVPAVELRLDTLDGGAFLDGREIGLADAAGEGLVFFGGAGGGFLGGGAAGGGLGTGAGVDLGF